MKNAWVFAYLLVLGNANISVAYVPDDPWTVTASGTPQEPGTAVTLTWSFAPDGTNIPDEGSSNLINYLDGLFDVTTTSSDLTERSWFSLFEQSFERWSELGGVTFIYEPNDNGTQLQSSSGIIEVRGDIRIGGAYLDGPSSTLAYAWLPEIGDLVLDTGETDFYSNSNNNYAQLRNTVMHELGHALGLQHVESSNANLLMEPILSTSFDGPQLDDIRGLHGLYGDKYEKPNNGLGNGTISNATTLGSLSLTNSISIGTDASTAGQSIAPTANDFASVTNDNDLDFYSFTIDTAGTLEVMLTPLGGIFSQGVEGGAQSVFDANARNDLSLEVFGLDGTSLLASIDDYEAGSIESISELMLSSPGEYFIRVAGSSDAVQLYELDLFFSTSEILVGGDYDMDGDVDGSDFLLWQTSFGQTGINLAADGNGNGIVDGGDFDIWKTNYGVTQNPLTFSGVPEPSSMHLLKTLAFLLLVVVSGVKHKRQMLK